MATPAQIAANRENAKRPRTLSEETKQSLRTRALKHGLATTLDANTVLKTENKQEFETIRNALLSEATLGTPEEILLINLQAQSYWKLQRAMNMESEALTASLIAAQVQEKVAKTFKDGEGLGSSLAFALSEQPKMFDKLHRYLTTAEKTFFRTTRELAMIRKAAPPEPIGYVPQTPQPEIGHDPKEIQQEAPQEAPPVQSRPELGGLTPVAFRNKLETMSEAEAFDYLDKLTAPPAACIRR